MNYSREKSLSARIDAATAFRAREGRARGSSTALRTGGRWGGVDATNNNYNYLRAQITRATEDLNTNGRPARVSVDRNRPRSSIIIHAAVGRFRSLARRSLVEFFLSFRCLFSDFHTRRVFRCDRNSIFKTLYGPRQASSRFSRPELTFSIVHFVRLIRFENMPDFDGGGGE